MVDGARLLVKVDTVTFYDTYARESLMGGIFCADREFDVKNLDCIKVTTFLPPMGISMAVVRVEHGSCPPSTAV